MSTEKRDGPVGREESREYVGREKSCNGYVQPRPAQERPAVEDEQAQHHADERVGERVTE